METQTETYPVYQIALKHGNVDEVKTKKLKHMLQTLDLEVELADHNYVQADPSYTVFDVTQHSELSVEELLEEVIRSLTINFDELPLLVEGESKIIRLLNDKIVLEKFKPTVYSFTQNRYGNVNGTEELRVKFTSDVFRRMTAAANKDATLKLQNAFLATIDTQDGTLSVQRRMISSNLEVRVKRYHVGSPVHRYKFTERQETVSKSKKPLIKWDRFEEPVVCFDWRLPLTDEDGVRLADEPISDDYAAIWMNNVQDAKELAKSTFKWLESLFSNAGFTLIDICFFVDQTGQYIFGEISPDCMRVRDGIGDPKDLISLDKDLWRNGETSNLLGERYNQLYERIFNNNQK